MVCARGCGLFEHSRGYVLVIV